jgi:predicted ester cyclase
MKRMLRGWVLLLILLVGVGAVAAQDDVEQSNKARVINALDALNAGDVAGFASLYPDEFLMNQGGVDQMPMSRNDVIGYLGLLTTAMPDLQVAPSAVIAQDDWVATQTTFTGTFTEPVDFFGMPLEPTDQVVTWTEMNFLQFADGEVSAAWALSDPTILFGQLGVFPAPETGATGTPLDPPAGYQTLSAEELAATFTSGQEARNSALLQEQIDLGLGADTSGYYADPTVAWTNARPYSVTTQQVQEESAFPAMLAAAMPDVAGTTTVTVAEGDWVATLVTFSGTFTEDVDFFGTPLTATDAPITWQFGVIDRFDADGLIVEEWVDGDPMPLLMGLGLIPPTP